MNQISKTIDTQYMRIYELGTTLTNDIGTTLTNLTHIELCSPQMQTKYYFQGPMLHLQKLTIHKDRKHGTNRTKGLKSDRPHPLTTEFLRQK